MKVKVIIRETPELIEALEELNILVLLTKPSKRLIEVIKSLFNGSQIITCKSDFGSAFGARKCSVLLKPSNRFLDLLAALRTGNINSKFI